MRHLSWISTTKYVALALIAVSYVVPIYSFPMLGNASRDFVYAWQVVQHDPVMGLAFLAPLLTPMLLSTRIRHPWSRILFACVPWIILSSVSVVYLESALTFSYLEMPFPMFPLPPLWTSTSIGIGCWAFVLGNGLLLVVWGAAIWKQMRSPLDHRTSAFS